MDGGLVKDGGGAEPDNNATQLVQAGGSEQVDHVAAHHVGWRVSCLLGTLWQGRKVARATGVASCQ